MLRAQCVDLGEPGLPYLAVTDLLRALGSDDPVAPVDAADESAPLAALPEDRGSPGRGRRGPRPGGCGARGPAVGGQLVRRLPPLPAEPDGDRTRRRGGDGPHRRSGRPPTGTPSGRRAGPAARRAASRPRSRSGATEVAQFLGAARWGRRTPRRSEDVLRRTGGNPYFVQALAAGVEQPTATLRRALTDLLAGRLDAALGRGAGRGRSAPRSSRTSCPTGCCATSSGLPDEAFDEAVRDAVADGVLRPDGAGYRVRARPGARSAV